MAWHVEVDEHTCIGSGMCASLMPEVFELNGAVAHPLTETVGEDETVLDAADSCPAMAITVTAGTEVVGPRP
ncbi:ferredoxin [Amycolatopsis sp. PS_44_ISF1]|uniref:ferredoxin n=1 Tax=Amycolatopsis sp. PS_44_ISF1 TaxID=2974917 RepID=UPI0028DF3121|nr:ferredoxin [Amycolatopsis sp. PS_44_ISF1]MDT8912146.1 ferredoxin [Amycolatopsis sp. PS_44_ISF1]